MLDPIYTRFSNSQCSKTTNCESRRNSAAGGMENKARSEPAHSTAVSSHLFWRQSVNVYVWPHRPYAKSLNNNLRVRAVALRNQFSWPVAVSTTNSNTSWLEIVPMKFPVFVSITGSTVSEFSVIRCSASSRNSSGFAVGVLRRNT